MVEDVNLLEEGVFSSGNEVRNVMRVDHIAPPKGLSEAQMRTWAEMYRVADLIRQRVFQVAQQHDLSVQQAQLLHRLDPEAPTSMRAIAELLGCDASNVTGLTDRLERRGLVERRALSSDRRVKQVVVTPEGMALAARFRAEVSADALLLPLSEAELETLTSLLAKLQGWP
jgi:DNA-binding MarR family transcriptional regulator